MVKQHFSHVRTWVFDLDNTLYPPDARLFDQIRHRMTRWVMDNLSLDEAEADALRTDFWHRHGTTLAGLMREHGVDPVQFMVEVHEIDLSVLKPDAALTTSLDALAGRRIVYTNGSAEYAGRVLRARGIEDRFDAIYGVEHAGYRPKPEREAFETIFALDALEAREAAMFEDEPRNLEVPHHMGLRTVLVTPETVDAAHIHHWTDDLPRFLAALSGDDASER